jgi:hypothetical protein
MIGWVSPVPIGGTISGGTRKLWDLSQILVGNGIPSTVITYADLCRGTPGMAMSADNVLVIPEVYDTEIDRLGGPEVRKVAFVQNGYLLNQTELVHPFETCGNLVAVLTACDEDTRLVHARCPRLEVPVIRTHSSGNGRLGGNAGFRYGYWPRRRRVLYFEYKNGPGSWTGGDLLGPLFADLELPKGWELVCLSGRSDEQIAELMRTSAIFVAPLRREGMCAPTSEAMISGCAIVGWTGGGAEEYLAGRAALVSQDDVAMLRERVYEVAAEIDRGSGHWPENTRRWSDWFQRTYSRDGEIREVCRIARQLGA